jgi:hypothetical protein
LLTKYKATQKNYPKVQNRIWDLVEDQDQRASKFTIREEKSETAWLTKAGKKQIIGHRGEYKAESSHVARTPTVRSLPNINIKFLLNKQYCPVTTG